MKQRRRSLYLFFLIPFLFSCNKTVPDEKDPYSEENIVNEVGEIRRMYASYKDQDVGIKLKTITYNNSYFSLNDNIKVVIVGKNAQKEIPIKSSLHSGYTFKANGVEQSSLPNIKEAGNYTFNFSFLSFTSNLNLEIKKANISDDVTLVVPKMHWLKNYTTPYLLNIPDDESIAVSYEYSKYQDSNYIPYTFKEDQINTTFLPNEGLVYYMKAKIISPNYVSKEIVTHFNIDKYTIKKEELTLSKSKLSFQYIPMKKNSQSYETLHTYEDLLKKNISVYFKDELLNGTLVFKDNNKQISSLGKRRETIIFTPLNYSTYESVPYEFDIDLTIERLIVKKPTVFCNSKYDYLGNNSMSPSYKFEGVEQEVYNTYYDDRSLIKLDYQEEREAGTYESTVSLKDTTLMIFDDGTINSYNALWTVKKADVNLETLFFYSYDLEFRSNNLIKNSSMDIFFKKTTGVEGEYASFTLGKFCMLSLSPNPDTGEYDYVYLNNLVFSFTLDDDVDKETVDYSLGKFVLKKQVEEKFQFGVTLTISNSNCNITPSERKLTFSIFYAL